MTWYNSDGVDKLQKWMLVWKTAMQMLKKFPWFDIEKNPFSF